MKRTFKRKSIEQKYLVCYFHWTDNVSSGFGDTVIIAESGDDIYTEEGLELARKVIIDRNKCSGCSIQNIIPLN